jgi:hypothetical protein
MDPRPLAPDKQTATLVDDFLAAQLAPRTRATYEGSVVNSRTRPGRRHPTLVADNHAVGRVSESHGGWATRTMGSSS